MLCVSIILQRPVITFTATCIAGGSAYPKKVISGSRTCTAFADANMGSYTSIDSATGLPAKYAWMKRLNVECSGLYKNAAGSVSGDSTMPSGTNVCYYAGATGRRMLMQEEDTEYNDVSEMTLSDFNIAPTYVSQCPVGYRSQMVGAGNTCERLMKRSRTSISEFALANGADARDADGGWRNCE